MTIHPAFSGYGIEIEHMIVNEASLDVAPLADQLLDAVGGAEDMDVDRGAMAWSNELCLHVIEMKTNGPTSDLLSSSRQFRAEVQAMEGYLSHWGARLMPTGMHPWMDPSRETRLWPHENNEIYQAFDRIFGCSGHGWSNLQSVHINFPFATELQLHLVHSACRFVLPLLPVLAASSPFVDGIHRGSCDERLLAYKDNCRRVPSVTGKVVPPVIRNIANYEQLLEGIYDDLRPHDPEGILAHEWVNARGCIARFDRGAVEIRLLDTQECPEQDLAVVSLVVAIVQALAEGEYGTVDELDAWPEERLSALLDRVLHKGARAPFEDYARVFGSSAATAGDLLGELIARHSPRGAFGSGLEVIAEQGCLAERLLRRVGQAPSRDELGVLYRELCDCLRNGRPFSGE